MIRMRFMMPPRGIIRPSKHRHGDGALLHLLILIADLAHKGLPTSPRAYRSASCCRSTTVSARVVSMRQEVSCWRMASTSSQYGCESGARHLHSESLVARSHRLQSQGLMPDRLGPARMRFHNSASQGIKTACSRQAWFLLPSAFVLVLTP